MKDTRIQPEVQYANRAPMVPEDDEIDLMDLFRALWRGKFTIALIALIAMSIGGYYAFGVAEPKYRSTAQLALNMRTKPVVDFESVVSGVSTDRAAMNTELEVILSRRMLAKVVDQLDLAEDPEFNPALRPPSAVAQLKGYLMGVISGNGDPTEPNSIEEEAANTSANRSIGSLRSALSASVLRDTYVFNIGATTGDPQKSAEVVNTLAEVYIQDQIEVNFQATEQAVVWLTTRVSDLETELRQKQEELKNAVSETDLAGPQALEAQNLRVKDLRDRLNDTKARLQELVRRERRLQELKEVGEKSELASMIDDPTLMRLLSSISNGENDAEELFDQRLEVLLSQMRTDRQRLDSQVVALENSYAELRARLQTQSNEIVRIQQMEREVESTRTLYETFLTRLKETSVQRGLQQADSRVLSDAIRGAQIAPRRSRIVVLSLILGLMAGAGLVLLRHSRNNTFRSVEELETATAISVVGQVPKMPIKSRDKLIGYLKDKPTSAAAEAIRNMRTSILLSNIDAPPKVIMFTSGIPGEGKTTQAVSLAQNLAGMGKEVLLVEGDLRRRTLSKYFSGAPKLGLLSSLSSEAPLNDVVFRSEELGADVIVGEKSTVNAADLLSSERFKNFIQQAREAYDFVVIDTPPVLVVPDARIIGQVVDSIIYCVEWDKTDRSQVFAGLREFEAVNLRPTGLVLTQIDPKGMKRYGYGGRYGAYAAYGYRYYDAK